MRKLTAVCPAFLLSVLLSTPALAAPQPSHAWQPIDEQNGGKISLDKARISRLPNGNTAAWSRLSLGFDIPDTHTGMRYSGIEALNSYNCNKREYATLKRIYVNDKGQPVREELVESPRSVDIAAGSFEEKLLPHVCKPRAVGEMKGLADQLVSVMNPPAAKPAKASAKTADLREQKAAAVTVADTGSKPRLIELPKIDPSTVENPAPAPKAPASKTAPVKPAPVKTEKPAASAKAKEEKQVPEVAADTKAEVKPAPTAKSTASTAASSPNYHTGSVSRAEIERQLATFGPRRLRSTQAGKAVEVLNGKSMHVHWDYDGKGSPANWSHISPDNQACANGKRQSPIDIKDGIRVDLEPIKFNYGSTAYSVIDNGHTVQVNIAEGQSLRVMERTYQLIQFHFHKPSEERVNGRSYDMVAHLVHKDADGKLAVVAILMEQGPENPLLQTIWNNLPLEQGMLVSPAAPIDLSKLLPEKRDYWTYMGSLTTPPCTEDVLWMVMKQPLQISADQVSIFGRLYPNNARPVQPTNNRLIKESR